MAYPTDLDTTTTLPNNWTCTDTDSGSTGKPNLPTLLNTISNALINIQTKLGIDSSLITTTIDYLISPLKGITLGIGASNKALTVSSTGKVDVGSITAFELPNSANPVIDTTGQIAVDTTLKGIKFHDGEAEKLLVSGKSATLRIESPTTSSETAILVKYPFAFTITKITALLVGSSTPSVTYILKHSTNRTLSGNSVVTGGSTVTSVTTGDEVTSFNDATVPFSSHLWLEISATSGTVDALELTIYFNLDVE